jgi:hypothetical protein
MDEMRPSMDAVRAWDGQEELSVHYFDGNPGYLTLTTTDLPDEHDPETCVGCLSDKERGL